MYCKFWKTTDANLHSCIQGLQTKRGLTGRQTPLNPVWIFSKGDPSQLGLKMVVFLAFLLTGVQRPTLFPWHIYQPSQGDLGPCRREAGQLAHQNCPIIHLPLLRSSQPTTGSPLTMQYAAMPTHPLCTHLCTHAHRHIPQTHVQAHNHVHTP